MINIQINAENGADARKELMDLLGLGTQTSSVWAIDPAVAGKDFSVKTIIQSGEVVNVEEQPAAEQPAAEPEKRKRRTKAEIEAEQAALAANTGSEEPPANAEISDQVSTTHQDQNKVEIPDASKVKEICAILVRAGKKDDAIKIIESFGVKTSPEIPEDKRAEFIEKAKAFADENNIAY